MVGDDDVGLRDLLLTPDGDQPGVAGPAADQHHAARAAARHGPGDAVGDRTVGEPGDDGVAHTDAPLRIAAAVHADDQVALPADRGRPDAGGGTVVGAGAEDAGAIGLLGDRRVDGPVVGGGDGVPGAVEVTGLVATADPGERSGRH